MDTVKDLRKEVIDYLETANAKTIQMIYEILEADAQEDWWNEMPDEVKKDVDAALKESENGEGMSHEEIKKKYSQWFAE
jgi:predicted phosphoadenosine phosphosulfate sulfurtransferase